MAAIDYGVIAFKNGHLIVNETEWPSKLGAGATFKIPKFIEMHRQNTHDLTKDYEAGFTFELDDGKIVHHYKVAGVDIKTKEFYNELMLTQFRYQDDNYSVIHGYDVDTRVVCDKNRIKALNKMLCKLSNNPLPFTIKYSQPFWERVEYKK